MLKGNGAWMEAPIPQGHTGSRVVFAHEGRCAILAPGEGYEIRDGSIVFTTPPPPGAVISFGEPVGEYTAESALNKITEAITQAAALSESLRLFVADQERRSNKMFYDRMKTFTKELADASDDLDAKFKNALTVAARDVRAELEEDFDEVRKLCKKAEEDREFCAQMEEMMDRRIRDANTDFDSALENCFAREGQYNEECEKLEAVIAEAKESLTKAKAEGIDALNAKRDGVMADIEAHATECERIAGSATARMTAIESRISRAGERAEYIEKLRRGDA